jgi:hypothetical protein
LGKRGSLKGNFNAHSKGATAAGGGKDGGNSGPANSNVKTAGKTPGKANNLPGGIAQTPQNPKSKKPTTTPKP